MSLGESIRSGTRWLMLSKVGNRLMEFAFGVALARLLVPAAFGLLVIPGVVEVPWNKDYPAVPYEKCWKVTTESIKQLLPHAKKHKVHLALENVWNCFLYSPLEFRTFVDQFGSEWVGAYFDVGNHHFMSQPDDWIRTLGKRIRRIHVKDFNRAKSGLDGFCEILRDSELSERPRGLARDRLRSHADC